MKIYREWNTRSINRPYLNCYWADRHRAGWHLEWGNGNSDPVWSIGVEFNVPAWFDRVLP